MCYASLRAWGGAGGSMSGRTRQQYGRSATTSYTNILHDSGGDILNRCSNLFSKFASRVRAASQSGEDRAPPHRSATASSTTATTTSSSSSSAADPMLLKYSRYDDPPRYNDYKTSSLYSDVKSKASRYEPSSPHLRTSGASAVGGYTPSRSGHALAPSASFSSFSTFKADYGGVDLDKNDLTPRKKYGSGGGGVRSTYGRTTSDISLGSTNDYGLGGAYLSLSAPTPNYDKIGARYKPSRFLNKSSLGTGGCVEEDEAGDELSVLRKNDSTKKTDYWSQYGSGITSPYVLDRGLDTASRRAAVGANLSPQLRRRHGDNSLISATGRQRPARPVTVPEAAEGRESTSSIIKRYSGLSAVDTDTGSTTSSATPDSVADESARRKERAQLLSMYSLPLNVLHNISSSNSSRKFLKRGGGENSGSGEHKLRYDQVKEMAAKVSAFSAFPDDEGSQGPPRKVYGSASAGDVLSAIAKASAKDTLSKHSTPDSEKFILHDPPIVFAKAAVRERPSGGTTTPSTPTTPTISSSKLTKPTSLALTRTYTTDLFRSPSDEYRLYDPLLDSRTPYHSILDHHTAPHYGLHTPPTPQTTPTIKVSNYMEPEHEYTFTTFKPSLAKHDKHLAAASTTNDNNNNNSASSKSTINNNNTTTNNNNLSSSTTTTTTTTSTTTTKTQDTKGKASHTNHAIHSCYDVLSDPTIGYVPAVSPASPQEHSLTATASVKPKTTTTSTSTSASVLSKHRDLMDTSYALAKYRAELDAAEDPGSGLGKNTNASFPSASLSTSASTSSLLGNVPPPPPPKKSSMLEYLGIHDYGGKSKHHYSFCSPSSVSSDRHTPAPPHLSATSAHSPSSLLRQARHTTALFHPPATPTIPTPV